MPYRALRNLVERIFSDLNAANVVPTPAEVWNAYASEIAPLLALPGVQGEFTVLGGGLWLPKALEAARVLQHLRQRFGPDKEGRPLVGRIRAEAVLKERPRLDRSRASLTGEEQAIAKLAPEFAEFSSFQVEGWRRVLEAIRNQSGLVIVAPTGAGKTEVFLMPIIYNIAQALKVRKQDVPSFVLLYPRVALLKDQLARIFRYIYYAEREYLVTQRALFGSGKVSRGIVIGFQFAGIASTAQYTLNNREIFADDRTFRIVEQCPICGQGTLKAVPRRQGDITLIRCDNATCGAEFRTSVSKNDHATTRPHLLVTTAESLDRLYLNAMPEFENYLQQIIGIVFDEVHLYHSLYGVHIYNLIRRIEELRSGKPLVKIAASATVSSPERFAAKLFYGDENHPVVVHSASQYPQEPAGLEVLYFLQSPEEENRPGAAPTLIQSVMAMGHSVLKRDDRALVFTESLDLAGRLEAQIRDAEERRRLWEFRLDVPIISFRNQSCPRTNPAACSNLYLEGECWRGILGGQGCFQPINGLRERALNVVQVSSQQRTRYWEGDVVVATPALEVGVDDERIKATVHYRPPRTVFSFIQRRGRAGRGFGEVAYTLMVLGNTPADHFYLFRRNRLVYGTYELPLNPQNPIVRAMHDRLRDERQLMRQFIQQFGSQEGIWRWIWETLERCPLIAHYYGQKLADQSGRSMPQQKGIVKSWIAGEKVTLESYLSLRWMLREIQDESPDILRPQAEKALATIEAFLEKKQGVDVNTVGQHLRKLYNGLGSLQFSETDKETRERLQTLQNRILQVWDALSQQAWGVELRHAEELYDFFRTLEGLYAQPWILNSAPDALKIVLQAMFYLHLGLEDSDEPGGCPSRVDYFIPEAYFQEVKPIVVEVRYETETGLPPDLRQEDVTDLATLLIPYKPVYRYHAHPFLSVVDTEHNPAWVSDDRRTVQIRLQAEGVRRGGVLIPQKVYVKPLRSDDQGQQIVKICPQCYAIYSINRQRRCHDNLRAVKLYADPIVERSYNASTARPITRTMRFLEHMQGTTLICGSDVRAFTAVVNGDQYVITRNIFRQFQALYETPVRYSLVTKGIAWNLAEVVECVLRDGVLRQQVEQIVVQGNRKTLNDNLVLHTAAHLLHKAIAAISGVNEQVLEYWYDPTRREVVVWERYEGGAGISEIFVDALRSNPTQVYRELLASVLCPVDLAERQDWTSPDNLRTELAERWRLSPDDEFIASIVREAESERQMQAQRQAEETRLVCRPPQGTDGCPACIHTTYCTDRDGQALTVSRLVGESLLRCLVQQVNRDEAKALINEAVTQEFTPPTILAADLERGVYDVLLL
jgi:hypothetical protein